MHAWQRRRIDLTKLLKNACGILFQMWINAKPISLTSLADLADGVTVVPFHPKALCHSFIHAQANNFTFQQDNARPHVA
jgi:hypothetical protein